MQTKRAFCCYRVAASVCLMSVIMALAAPVHGEGLERLKFNHPGLTVDLGVGLWAWPIPCDADGDGDTDLIVVCPDKPYNGTWFFENTTGSTAKDKFPVFKPARRLGKGLSYATPSYVDGKLRVLRPNFEYPDFLRTGLDQNVRLPVAGDKIHKFIHDPPRGRASLRHNQWKYVDFDGDGTLDLVVAIEDWTDYGWDNAYDSNGRWTNGPLHGLVYILRNIGTTAEPKYAPAVALEAGGQRLDTYGCPSPNFVDFDHDGDLDLLCGEFLDGFTYFENLGTRTAPRYAAGRRLKTPTGEPLTMDLEMIVPVAFDWDSDGDADLIVGDEDGRVALVENTGQLAGDRTPQFLPPHYFQQEADDVKFGALATPVGYDWDGDGDFDIISGNTAGYLAFIENLSGPGVEQPKWAAPSYLEAEGKRLRIMAGPNGSIQGPAEAKWGYTTQSVADWDGDGLPDILVNSILGKVVWYRNVGTRSSPKLAAAQPIEVEWQTPQPALAWGWLRPEGKALLTQWRTTPVAVDWNQDGLTDLIMLDHEGFLVLYLRAKRSAKRILLPPQRVLCDEQKKPLQLSTKTAGGSGRRKISIVDWDGDGGLDLLLNSSNANLLRQIDSRDGRWLFRDMGPLDQRNIEGHDVSPTTVDFNGDGVPDFLGGAEDGHFYYLRNPHSKEQQPGLVSSEFIYESAPFPSCHASTIVETKDGLVAGWFAGTAEGKSDVGIWVSRKVSGGWTAPVEIANGIQTDGTRHPCWNPVLFQPQTGPLMLFYKVGPSPQRWWGMLRTSDDSGRTWSEARRLPEGILGPIKNKPVQLASGDLLCPTSTESTEKPSKWRVHFERSSDGGATWTATAPVNDGQTIGAIQPSILSLGGDKLFALGRTRQGKIFRITSDNLGKTWGEMTLTALPNPNSGTDAVTLKDGRHLLIYNHTSRGRSPLNLALSQDGITWQAALILEQDPGEYSYPAISQTSDGMVHITYTWKRQKVRHAVVDPAKIVLREIINGKWPK